MIIIQIEAAAFQFRISALLKTIMETRILIILAQKYFRSSNLCFFFEISVNETLFRGKYSPFDSISESLESTGNKWMTTMRSVSEPDSTDKKAPFLIEKGCACSINFEIF